MGLGPVLHCNSARGSNKKNSLGPGANPPPSSGLFKLKINKGTKLPLTEFYLRFSQYGSVRSAIPPSKNLDTPLDPLVLELGFETLI